MCNLVINKYLEHLEEKIEDYRKQWCIFVCVCCSQWLDNIGIPKFF